MKKIIWLFQIVLMIVLFISCKKENRGSTAETEKKFYEIKNGLVHFFSASSYNQFLESATGNEKNELIATLRKAQGYESILKNPSKLNLTLGNRLIHTGDTSIDDDIDDLLSSDLLGSIINSDGLVQIGDYIFNVNLVREKCFALHSSWAGPASETYRYDLLLNENASNIYVFEFSTDDDVLDILENLGNPTVKDKPDTIYASKRCGESAVAKRKDDGTEYFPRFDQYVHDRVECKVVYQKAGIYFALLGKLLFKASGQGNWQSRRDWYQWKFKPKCWNERVQPYTTSFTTNAGNGYKKYAWESTRGLSKYDVNFQWEIKGHARTSNTILKTRVYGIRAGY
jgi:hypothetical protein